MDTPQIPQKRIINKLCYTEDIIGTERGEDGGAGEEQAKRLGDREMGGGI